MIDPTSYLYGILTVMLPLSIATTVNWFIARRRWDALEHPERRRKERRKP